MPTFTNKVSGALNAIEGESQDGRGVTGTSDKDYGMRAHSAQSAGLRGSSDKGRGVEGWAIDSEGVVGISKNGTGVWGQAAGKGTGVIGTSEPGFGVAGRSQKSAGVRGDSMDGVGVEGASITAYGVAGASQRSAGVRGTSDDGRGVEGWSTKSEGVFGLGRTGGYFEGSFEGIHAVSHDPHAAGIAGYNDNTGPAIFGKSTGGGPAGYFDGEVVVTGDIRLANADCAEDFDVFGGHQVGPGTVMVLGPEGALCTSVAEYDRCAAGIISGAGDYKPGLVLDNRRPQGNRLPLALMGKTFCKVDAQFGAIEVGDLLTTSATPGHAMKAVDPVRAFGAVIGKALRPFREGTGLIPVLVTLQ
jgi:hypothetical protein